MEEQLVNRVATSGLITINLEDFFPKEDILTFDLKDYLFMELVLKEKDFRSQLKTHDWGQYENKNLIICCSTDAIIPMWAYMLVTTYATPYARHIFQGSPELFYQFAFLKALDEIDFSQYLQKRIVVKGCSGKPIPPLAYVALTQRLQPYAQSIMYGEPCSTVPVFKRPRIVKKV